jgi:hypothetical protein
VSTRKLMATEKLVIGEVEYDVDSSDLMSNQCNISVPSSSDLKRGLFVKIGNGPSYYLGQIVDGPYYIETQRDPIKRRYIVELTSFIENDLAKAALSRPVPGTIVEHIESSQVQRFLGISGGMYMGAILTDRKVGVMMDPATLSRHIGIFGTTGGGKSNTIQVLMEEASNQDYSIMVFDVEGEYIEMDRPTDMLTERLASFGREPKGAKDLKVYAPYPCFCHRADAIKFGITFKDVEKGIFAEVAGLNRMEQLYFQDLIEKVTAVTPEHKTVSLGAIIDRLEVRLKGQSDHPTMPPFIAEAHTTLYSKLQLMVSQNLIDIEAPDLMMEEILKPGRVSVVDFSDASDSVRNIVMADLLYKTFNYKIAHPESGKLFTVMEEAHAFISKEKRERMLATLMMVIEVARRGRKRGLSLGIVTQQPAHLPSELLELCNTRIIHRMSSTANIDVLRESTGNVPDGLWNTVPSLGRGEAIVASHKYSQALSVLMRPTASKRKATE